MKCLLCGNECLIPVCKRNAFPVLGNIILDTKEKALNIQRGDIELYRCESCGFTFNSRYQAIDYNNEYENFQGCSPAFKSYTDNLARRISTQLEKDGSNVLIVEIGCGQGEFLTTVLNMVNLGNIKVDAVGFDPALRDTKTTVEKLQFIDEYFSYEKLKEIITDIQLFDLIVYICRHVIEHVADPHLILKECEKTENDHVKCFFETPDFDWIIEHEAFEDICYEHCSWFNQRSIVSLFENHHFKVSQLKLTFQNQYMWIEAEKVSHIRLGEDVKLREWKKLIENHMNNGYQIFVWGSGEKGVSFINLIDARKEYIHAVIDVNKRKQGNYIAGTGHKIVAPDILKSVSQCVVIIMNVNYEDEIKATCEEMETKPVFFTL